ncbi:hypothetical protein [Yinghuangia soli]|uniref:Uncharacterized protein n=1 Tax=Yinghuangia soli TaxID=2908204 RepID=A0AA41Q3P7_9ACTN|nr:hypothetical protein [Yinghuangia soli]MCF2529512.1 hypothetical protein [Yinghuangia soli]
MNTHHPGQADRPGAGEDAGLGSVLAEAMAGLQPHEPGMPDLLGPAMAEGTRIRRRRRTTMLVAFGTAVVLGIGGAIGGVSYVGGDQGRSVSPADSPTAVDAADGGTLGPAERLAAVLRLYLEPRGLALAAKPWAVRANVENGAGSMVAVTVQDAAGNTAMLQLSTGKSASGGRPEGLPGEGCSLLFKADRELVFQHEPETVSCKVQRQSAGGSYTWVVTVDRPAPNADRRIGAVRVGPDDGITRAWAAALPQVPPAGVAVLREDLLADIARDPAVTDAIVVVAAEEAAGRGIGTAVPWSTAVPAPTKYAQGSSPPAAGLPKP